MSNDTIFIWDYETSTLNKVLSGATSQPTFLKFLSDGRLAGQSSSGTINVWNVQTGSVDLNLTADAYSLEELWNGLLASSGSDLTLKIWNLTDGNLVNSVKLNSKREQYFLKQTNVHNYLASGEITGKIYIWNTSTYTIVNTLIGHTSNIYFMITFGNGLLVSVASDSYVRLWNITNGTCLSSYNPYGSSAIYAVALASNDSIAISGASEFVIVAQLNSSNSFVEKAIFNMNVSYVNDLRATSDNILLMTLAEGSIAYLNLTTLTVTQTVTVAPPFDINYLELDRNIIILFFFKVFLRYGWS